MEISYETNFLDTDDVPLTTDNECFTVNISIKNIGEQKIYDLHMLPAKEINGLRYENESNRIWIEELDSEEEQKVQLQYNKTSYRGYLISAPVFTTAMENSFIREKPGNPLLLGRFNLTIVKTFEKLESDIGEVITIDINITNTGTLELGNFTLDDTLSYDSAGFNIKRGVMIKEISYLGPGEKDSLQYTLRARAKGIFKMNPAKVEYYYKYRQIVNSNIENFVVHEPSWLMTGRIYLPIILGVFTMLTTYHYKTKYNKADLELQRKEKLLFGADLRDTSWHKRTLKEMLEMEFKSKNGGDQK